jgi:hypothetical protein
MASAICDLSIYLNEQDTLEYVLPTISLILKDSVTEVRVSLLENLGKLAKSLSE